MKVESAYSNDSPSQIINEFFSACDAVKMALHRLKPEDLLQDANKADPFATRMAAAAYRAIASQLDAIAKRDEG